MGVAGEEVNFFNTSSIAEVTVSLTSSTATTFCMYFGGWWLWTGNGWVSRRHACVCVISHEKNFEKKQNFEKRSQ